MRRHLEDHPNSTAFIVAGGHVFDGHRYRRDLAVGVSQGRIRAVGRLDEVRDRVGRRAEQIDAKGGLVLPGFHDSHMHPMVGGLERLRLEMSGLSGVDEYLSAIADHASRQPGRWVRGGGWSVDQFDAHGPTAALLDQVVPDRPAFLPSTDHHDAWVNTRALEIAGVTNRTPDPPGGWIERDEAGNPTGTLREAAMALVWDHLDTSREEYAEALREAQNHLHTWGITGWTDALIGGYAGLDDPTQAYLDLLERDELTAHVRAAQWWDRQRGVEQIPELLERRESLATAGLDAGSVKVMLDGVAETFTAALGAPYGGSTGCPCGDSGMSFLSRDEVIEAVVALDAAGLQVHVHAIGDQAVHDALDAVEAARSTHGLNGLRHQIAHLQLVRPEDRGRFVDLDVIANVQGMWARRGTPAVDLLEPHLDTERFGWHYPFADLAATGAVFAGGSDWPVNPPEPIGAVHVLVNRTAWTPDGTAAEPLFVDQALSLTQGLAAYTSGAARAAHHDSCGTFQVGAAAELVLLDRDPFAGPPEEIGAAEVVGTWAHGTEVYRR